MLDYLADLEIPTLIVITKVDKLGTGARRERMAAQGITRGIVVTSDFHSWMEALDPWADGEELRVGGVAYALHLPEASVATANAAGLRRLNAGLRVRPYARVGDTAAIVVHRSRAGCEAELAGGLPALGESPCRAWYLRGAGG